LASGSHSFEAHASHLLDVSLLILPNSLLRNANLVRHEAESVRLQMN
jgi:hypothetical protein